jgi:uncharacterized protein (TIGR03437 family)
MKLGLWDTEKMSRFVTFLGVVSVFTGSAYADAQGAYLYSWADPPVIWNDGTSTFTLQVATTKTSNPGITSVTYYTPNGWVALYDDGKTGGDLKAGDGIYTLNTATLPVQPLTLGGVLNVIDIGITITTADGKSQYIDGAKIGVVGVGLQFPSVSLGSIVQATKSAFFVSEPGWTPTSGFLSSEQQGTGLAVQAAFLRRATNSLYAVLPDQFDFIVAMPGHQLLDPKSNYGEGSPFFVRGKETVQNIGLSSFDVEKTYGSKGRLQGVVYHSFGLGAILTHEFGHNWAAFIGTSQNLSACSACTGAHWNGNADIGSIMGGLLPAPGLFGGFGQLSANPDGTWRLVRDPLAPNGIYSMLDLYLMGLVPSSAVPPIHLLTNPDLSNINHVTAQSVATYHVLDLTGERVPNSQNAPKQFSTAFVIVKEKGFTPAELTFFSLLAQQYTQTNPPAPVLILDTYLNPFARATGGRATMTADLPVSGVTPPATSYYSILNDATRMPGPLAPGSMFDILGNFSGAAFAAAPNSVVYTLNQVSVQLDATKVRLYSMDKRMVVAAIPQLVSQGVHTLTVKVGSSVALTQQITIIQRNAAAYTWTPDPAHQNIRAPKISDANGKMVGDPSLSKNYVQVKGGDTLAISGTGGGGTNPGIIDNTPAPVAGTYTFVPPQIQIDGTNVDATTVNGSRATGSFSVDKVTFVVPAGLSSGPHALMYGGAIYANALWIK